MLRSLTLAACVMAAPLPFAASSEAHVVTFGSEARAASILASCPTIYSVEDYRSYASKVYRRKRISQKAHKRMSEMHRCQHSYRARIAVGRYHDRFLAERKERKALERVAPYDGWAIPAYIVMCESGGNFRAVNTSNPARPAGAYQIITSTWLAWGGGVYAPTADQASPYAQHLIARRIWRGAGPSQWECA